MSAQGPSTAERLSRLERISWLLALRAGLAGRPGLGPMDPAWQRLRRQAEADLDAIAEQAEAPLETRGTAA